MCETWKTWNLKFVFQAIRDLETTTPLSPPLSPFLSTRVKLVVSGQGSVEMVSQITLCSARNARSRPAGGCRLHSGLMCRWDTRTSVCLWDVVCAWHAVSRMGPKVVGILLEGEKYELAAETPPTACVHARSNREEVSVRRRGEERARTSRTR